VNGAFASTDAVLPKLHVPTRPVPLELVLWHLIVEWGVKPKRDDWQHILEDSMGSFETSRRVP
jgi:hypothetical protein